MSDKAPAAEMPVPLPPLRCCLLLWHPCIKGWLQPEQMQDMIRGIIFWEEILEEPALLSLAEERLSRDVRDADIRGSEETGKRSLG